MEISSNTYQRRENRRRNNRMEANANCSVSYLLYGWREGVRGDVFIGPHLNKIRLQ
jgi:hypothetical protein